MLQYQSNESKNSSHFFITTEKESLHLLEFKKVEEENISFSDTFLQENVQEMQMVRLSDERESYCKSLCKTAKSIFDNMLFKHDDLIIYLSVPFLSGKDHLIQRIINEDNNDEFFVYDVIVGDYTLYFFFNEHKTSSGRCLKAITNFFKIEYDIDLKIQS